MPIRPVAGMSLAELHRLRAEILLDTDAEAVEEVEARSSATAFGH